MKTTFKTDRSRVMTKAWEIKKGRNGWAFTFSQCLKQAWKQEKKSVERMNETYNRDNYSGSVTGNVKNVSLDFLSNTLTNYYMYNTYNGD
jgi:hypothetical protein